MNSILRRRRALMGAQGGEQPVDTSPIIATDGVYFNRSKTTTADADYCVTERYELPSPVPDGLSVNHYMKISNGIASNNNNITNLMYKSATGAAFDFWGAGSGKATTGTTHIAFTIKKSALATCYCYVDVGTDKGVILFAGPQSQYYGKHSIYD